MKLTTAGRAAMVNPDNTGTAPVRISEIGVTGQSFVATAALTSLPGEIKRLRTFAGAAVADDTIHVTLRDDSVDQYTLWGFGLYAEGGLLVATFCATSPIMEKSAQAMLLLAVDGRIEDVLATSLTFGDTDWMNPPATTTVQGVVELADNDETIAGVDSTRAATAAGIKAALNARFGATAPSAFVKPLLALTTAALLRGALEIKSAALRDEGAGKGLDADLLDGQQGAYYLDWENLTGKPQAFPPSGHRHAWGALDNVPNTASRWPTWGEVTEKPTAFPPSNHVHAAADVQTGVFDVARIPDLDQAKITGLVAALAAKAARFNPQFTGTGIKIGAENAGESVIAFGVDDFYHYSNPGAIGIFSTAKGQVLQISKSNKWAEFYGTVAAPNFVAMDYGNNGGFVQIGNDCQLIDVGRSNAFQLRGLQNPATGYIFYGNADNYIGWNGSSFVANDKTLWHAGNFTPDSKASLNASVTFADVYAFRGNGTGVIFLGRGDRYLFWDGSSYQMPGAQLVVDGGFQKGSSRELKNIDGPLPYGLADLMRIETAIGSYKEEYLDDGGRKRLFVIAEQLREIVPEPVFDEAVEFGGRHLPGVEEGQLVPLLIKAVQELAQRVVALEDRR
ncbi:hypothetical protein ACI2IY_12770 [Lysobacter enzymogenes]|uniref:hypothetical protein n=1 Tax=Lysobacter enzymogenes TaxID=69 RepID=UPI00384D98C7